MAAGSKSPDALAALRTFARRLGWSPLRRYQHIFADHTPPQTIVWYEAGVSRGGRSDVFLQINEDPIGAKQTYAGAVYAPRFRLFTGWHAFRLSAEMQCDLSEVDRLNVWLHYRWFESPNGRRAFRAGHPECRGYSWKRIRQFRQGG